MTTSEPAKATIVIPFVCPICAGANAVHLITLSRAGGMDCAVCSKWLRAADVMRAMHSPRPAREAGAGPLRTHEVALVTGPKPAPGLRGSGPRPAPKRAGVTWPPTAESRAAATPLYRRG